MNPLFINRKKELQKITTGLKDGNSYVLIAPRRYGKTALASKVLDAIDQDKKYLTVRIDFMTYSGGGIRSVAEGIIEKILNTLGFAGKLRLMWRQIDVSLKLRVRYNELEIEPLLHMFRDGDEWALLEEALDLAQKIAQKEKKHLVVFYNEFGELNTFGTRLVKVFRSVIQQHKNVSYLFAGSQETIMNKMFVEYSGAFYRFGNLIYLGNLDKDDIYQYIKENFPNVINPDYEYQILDEIINVLNGHPYYTAQTIEYLRSNPSCTFEYLYNFLHFEMVDNERAYLNQQILKIKEKLYALDVLRILSLGLNPYSELKTIKKQTISKVLTHLGQIAQIRRLGKGDYQISDPALSMLLLND